VYGTEFVGFLGLSIAELLRGRPDRKQTSGGRVRRTAIRDLLDGLLELLNAINVYPAVRFVKEHIFGLAAAAARKMDGPMSTANGPGTAGTARSITSDSLTHPTSPQKRRMLNVECSMLNVEWPTRAGGAKPIQH